LGKDVARGLGEALGLPVIYHEVIDHLADRMRVRKSHVIRLLDGSAGLLERLSADKTSLSIYTADEIYGLAALWSNKGGAIIRGWGATHLLREIPHVVGVRVCAPFELRKTRMMERLASDDEAHVAEEIRANDEAHSAIMRRHFAVQWTEPEHYDVVLNTKRVAVEECVSEVLTLARAPQFEDTERSRAILRHGSQYALGGKQYRRDARIRGSRLRRGRRARRRLSHQSRRGTAPALSLAPGRLT